MHGGLSTLASKRKKPRPAAQEADPTPERMLKARGAVEYGDDGRGRRVLTVRDAPLERARARGAISEPQYQAGMKYYSHWYRAGLGGKCSSFELDRVFGGFNGLRHSEAQAFHANQLAAARDWLGEHVSIIDRVIVEEMPLEAIGRAYGWKNESQAIAAATERLKLALDRLCGLWGM